MTFQTIRVMFDGPPGHVTGRFVETETVDGKGIGIGKWVQCGNYWALEISVDASTIRHQKPADRRPPL